MNAKPSSNAAIIKSILPSDTKFVTRPVCRKVTSMRDTYISSRNLLPVMTSFQHGTASRPFTDPHFSTYLACWGDVRQKALHCLTLLNQITERCFFCGRWSSWRKGLLGVARGGCLFERNRQCDKTNCAYGHAKNAIEQY